MSLENEIKQLTIAINQLNQTLLNGATQQTGVTVDEAKTETKKVEAKTETSEVKVETKTKSESLTFTHTDLKEELMKAARRDRKAECKALLAEYGAKKVTEIADSDIEEVLNKAKEL